MELPLLQLSPIIMAFPALTAASFVFFLLVIAAILPKTALSPPAPAPVLKSLPMLGCLIPFYRNRRRLLHWYTDQLAASPSQTICLSRLGARRTVITANPSNVRHILSTNFLNYPKGKPFTEILGDLLGRGIFNSDGHHWLSQRKLASHAFTLRSLRSLVDDILQPDMTDCFLPALAVAPAVDLQDCLRSLSFRIICRVVLGTSEDLPELAKALDVASEISAGRGAAPVALVWKIKRALVIGKERFLRESVELVHSSVTDIIRSSKKEADNSILSRLVVEGYKDEEIRDMAISFLMAGRDTTSSALTCFFWLVSTHPEVGEEITKELAVVMRSGEEMNYERMKELKYLEAALMETMRLYPPVVWDSKHAVGDDVLPDGTVIRSGDRVTYFPYGMGRMKGLWGNDWEQFRPERWLAAGRVVVRVSPYNFPVFQAGPRVCLGKEMAMVQMKFVGSSVLHRFKVRWLGKEAPAMVPLLTAHMAGGLPVELWERGLWGQSP